MKSYELCQCGKPLINENNIGIFRKRMVIYVAGGGITGIAVGVTALPFLGFTSIGVAGASIAAGWQSAIGSVAAGSTFALLQSLGATNTGTLLFGAIGGATGAGALGIMKRYAAKFRWCQCKPSFNKSRFP